MNVKQINRYIAGKAAHQLRITRATRRALAIKMGCSPAYVTKLLRGRENLTIETCVKLANALNLTLKITLSV